MLGEDEDWLHDVCIEMDPEDGRLIVLGLGEEAITAFTDFGVDNLTELAKISTKPPPTCSGDIRHVSDMAAVLTGCWRIIVAHGICSVFPFDVRLMTLAQSVEAQWQKESLQSQIAHGCL